MTVLLVKPSIITHIKPLHKKQREKHKDQHFTKKEKKTFCPTLGDGQRESVEPTVGRVEKENFLAAGQRKSRKRDQRRRSFDLVAFEHGRNGVSVLVWYARTSSCAGQGGSKNHKDANFEETESDRSSAGYLARVRRWRGGRGRGSWSPWPWPHSLSRKTTKAAQVSTDYEVWT